jgi:hypothetical protein
MRWRTRTWNGSDMSQKTMENDHDRKRRREAGVVLLEVREKVEGREPF